MLKILYNITYKCIKKNRTNELMCKAETEIQTQRTNVWIPRGKGGGGMDWETGIDTIDIYALNIYTLDTMH